MKRVNQKNRWNLALASGWFLLAVAVCILAKHNDSIAVRFTAQHVSVPKTSPIGNEDIIRRALEWSYRLYNISFGVIVVGFVFWIRAFYRRENGPLWLPGILLLLFIMIYFVMI